MQLVPAFESGATTAESQGEDATAQDEDREDAKSLKKKALANAVLTTEQKVLLWKRIDATARAYEDDAARAACAASSRAGIRLPRARTTPPATAPATNPNRMRFARRASMSAMTDANSAGAIAETLRPAFE